MATKFSVVHAGNVGTLRLRYEDLQEIVGKDGKKTKKWVLSPNSLAIGPHEQQDAFAATNARRIVIEEAPT